MKLGVKWYVYNVGFIIKKQPLLLSIRNMFSSEKVLQMRYADYQGKEALIEKFKNSCVMDERESWRPKIFYSSGQGEGIR